MLADSASVIPFLSTGFGISLGGVVVPPGAGVVGTTTGPPGVAQESQPWAVEQHDGALCEWPRSRTLPSMWWPRPESQHDGAASQHGAGAATGAGTGAGAGAGQQSGAATAP